MKGAVFECSFVAVFQGYEDVLYELATGDEVTYGNAEWDNHDHGSLLSTGCTVGVTRGRRCMMVWTP